MQLSTRVPMRDSHRPERLATPGRVCRGLAMRPDLRRLWVGRDAGRGQHRTPARSGALRRVRPKRGRDRHGPARLGREPSHGGGTGELLPPLCVRAAHARLVRPLRRLRRHCRGRKRCGARGVALPRRRARAAAAPLRCLLVPPRRLRRNAEPTPSATAATAPADAAPGHRRLAPRGPRRRSRWPVPASRSGTVGVSYSFTWKASVGSGSRNAGLIRQRTIIDVMSS